MMNSTTSRILGSMIVGVLVCVGLVVFPKQIFAGNDIVVVCDQDDCTQTVTQPIFSETNLVPGETRSQTLTIVNQDPTHVCEAGIVFSSQNPDSDLSTQFFVAVSSGSTSYLGEIVNGKATSQLNLQHVLTLANSSLGTILQNSSKTYDVTVTLNTGAGNEYQNRSTTFDIVTSVSCTEPSEQNDNNGGGGGGAGGGGGTNNSSSNTQSDQNQSGVADILGVQFANLGTALGQIAGIVSPDTTIDSNSEVGLEDETGSGEISGVSTEKCTIWRFYLPLFLLLIQTLFAVSLEIANREPKARKLFISLVLSGVTILVFYWLREMGCYHDAFGFMLFIAKWFAPISLILALVLRGAGSMTVEEK